MPAAALGESVELDGDEVFEGDESSGSVGSSLSVESESSSLVLLDSGAAEASPEVSRAREVGTRNASAGRPGEIVTIVEGAET